MSKKFKQMQGKLNKELKKYSKLGGMYVKVGLPDDRIHNPSGMRLSELGMIHEFGTDEIPERPFIRGYAWNEKKEIKENLIITTKNIKNGMDPQKAVEQLALAGQGGVQDYIASKIPPPNAGEGMESKTPLIDTGEMRQSIIGQVIEKSSIKYETPVL